MDQWCNPRLPAFVIHKSGSSSLDSLKFVDVEFGVRVPHRAAILQRRSDICTIESVLDLGRASFKISVEEVYCGISFAADVANMLIPREVVADGDS